MSERVRIVQGHELKEAAGTPGMARWSAVERDGVWSGLVETDAAGPDPVEA